MSDPEFSSTRSLKTPQGGAAAGLRPAETIGMTPASAKHRRGRHATEVRGAVGEARLQATPPSDPAFAPDYVCRSSPLLTVWRVARRVAESDVAVLLTRESGSGNEVFADFSNRAPAVRYREGR